MTLAPCEGRACRTRRARRTHSLPQDLPAALVEAVLAGRPATAGLHENLPYAGWGVSRSPLARAIESRAQATRSWHA